MTTSAKKNHADKEIVILTATSNVGKGLWLGLQMFQVQKIIVFYPKHGVSPDSGKTNADPKGGERLCSWNYRKF